ncbi:hypothetical protein [Limnoglobus roseus]|uniref:Uncharacterized protein n=1 Tax=Limnoglobus roseus TaxID=2598579 RepID=A0A5C1AD67_9BACT|nr:hypothetical protein [Limnoglobus roseus]QEL15712.1 hypothetical protein PX52LOC_02647 [Limnoglobus roseus]
MRYLTALMLSLAVTAFAAAETKKGTPEVKSISALAFGPNGTLFVGDPVAAAVFAVETGDTKGTSTAGLKVEKVTDQIGSLLGVTAKDVTVNDVKVNPATGNVFLAVTRGKGPDAKPVVLKVAGDGKLTEFALKDVAFTAAPLVNAIDKDKERMKQVDAITSMGFANGKLIVAGLSNEDFSSTLRVIPFPFGDAGKATGVKIFHGAHGRFETQAPVRTFTTYRIGDAESVVAAYQCTPLVKFPISDLQPGAKVTGTTIAELGNRNVPIDMFVYSKGGKDYILMANTARGVMKVSTDKFAVKDGITQKTGEFAGATYEKVESWSGVEQIDKLDDTHAIVLMKTTGSTTLASVELP